MAYRDLRVLLVDDQIERRKALKQRIAAQGVTEIWEVGRAAQALALMHGLDFQLDLVVTDLELPDSDGLELIHAATQDSSLVKLVLLTDVDAEILHALKSLPQGAKGSCISAIPKPLDDARIVKMLGRAKQLRAESRRQLHHYSLGQIAEGIEKGQFVAFLEPQIAFDSNLVSGFEALARWRHPVNGDVSPSAFITMVEDSDLLGPFTFAVLDSALESLAGLRLAGYTGGISINLGARSLIDPSFPGLLAERVHRAGLRYSDLMLEITETKQASDSIAEISGLARLRMIGFRLAIDDFGMGYSSLAKVSQGAFNEVKIDRQFTACIDSDPSSRAAVESTLTLAQSLNWICVAEGIETEAVKQSLIALGCRTGQGHLFSRPLAPEAVVNWWKGWEESRLLSVSGMRTSARTSDAGNGPAILGDERLLAALVKRSQPAWVFDLDHLEMAWANEAAVLFWDAASRDELLNRDFRKDMTPATRERLGNLRQVLRGRGPLLERWTLYPNSQPKTVDCTLTGLFGTNGRASLLVEAQPVEQIELEGHLESEAMRAAGVPAFVVSPQGIIEWRNAFAAACFGVRKTSMQAHFVSPMQASDMVLEAMHEGHSQRDAFLGAGCGAILHRVNFRRMRDRSSGRELISGIMTSIGDLSRGQTCRLLCNQPCPNAPPLALEHDAENKC